MAHPLLEKAAQHVAQARAINDEFAGKDMPAEAAHQMEQHVAKAGELRSRVTREANLADNESWLSDPEYKHDMGAGGARSLTGIDHGNILLESERTEKQRESFFNFVRKGMSGVAPDATRLSMIGVSSSCGLPVARVCPGREASGRRPTGATRCPTPDTENKTPFRPQLQAVFLHILQHYLRSRHTLA